MRTPNYYGTIDDMRRLGDRIRYLKNNYGREYHIKMRGRHSDRQHVAMRNGLPRHAYNRDIPIEHSERVDVYLYPKRGDINWKDFRIRDLITNNWRKRLE